MPLGSRNIYTDGAYLATNQSWHAEDSAWKAGEIAGIVLRNALRPERICEIGCGVGAVLEALCGLPGFESVEFSGYDISPQAIQLARGRETARLRVYCDDLLAKGSAQVADILLIIDVLEHVPDAMAFASACKGLARHKVFHVPLEVSVASVARGTFVAGRYTVGHVNYFSAESAVATLRDAGHVVVDSCFTASALGLYREHPSLRTGIANIPRWLGAKVSAAMAARWLGGFSLLVLTE